MTPPLVERARRLAGTCDCEPPCRDEDGMLLHVLAGRRGLLRAGEVSAGCGVSAAWIVSALLPGTPFVTVVPDAARAATVRELFASDPAVNVLAGDWRDLLPAEAPFDLLVVAGGVAAGDPDGVVDLLAPGGTVAAAGAGSGARALWRDHPGLQATAVDTGGRTPVILGVRVR